MRTGARQGKHKDRLFDLYETPPCSTHALIRTGELDDSFMIWEPCAGKGAIADILWKEGFSVKARDLVAYEGANPWIEYPFDFFEEKAWIGRSPTIVTNPPFMHADRFIRHALSLGCKTVVLLRLMALEGTGRSDIIDGHLRRVWMGKERLPWMHKEGWTGNKQAAGGVPFCWFVFEPSKRLGVIPIELRRISWRE